MQRFGQRRRWAAAQTSPRNRKGLGPCGSGTQGAGRSRARYPGSRPGRTEPPISSSDRVSGGRRSLTAGRLDKAERLYRQLLRADPQYANALHLLGVIAFQRDNSEVAIGLISQAIEIIPTFPSYHCNLGNVYSKMGRLDEAVASFRTTIEFNPHYAEAYYNLANILKEQKKFDEAVEAYHRVIELQPSYAEAYYNLANITSDLGKFDDEITSYRQAV